MKTVRYLIPLLLVGYLATGFYIVGPDEQAVVKRFGKARKHPTLPGLRYDFPLGLSSVHLIKPAETKRIWIGRLADDRLGNLRFSEFLTGDQNIIHVQATIQYTISDPRKYVVTTQAPVRLLRYTSESQLADVIAHRTVDYVRGEGGAEIQNTILRNLQHKMDTFESGLTITAVNLDSVLPPLEVVDYFRQASDARNIRDQLINQAEAEKQRTKAESQSQAQEVMNQSQAYRDQVVQKASGSSARYRALLSEYRKSKVVMATRLYFETMERILSQLQEQLIIDPKENIDLSLLKERKR